MRIINPEIDIGNYMKHFMFKGKDGKDYATVKDLNRAYEQFLRLGILK